VSAARWRRRVAGLRVSRKGASMRWRRSGSVQGVVTRGERMQIGLEGAEAVWRAAVAEALGDVDPAAGRRLRRHGGCGRCERHFRRVAVNGRGFENGAEWKRSLILLRNFSGPVGVRPASRDAVSAVQSLSGCSGGVCVVVLLMSLVRQSSTSSALTRLVSLAGPELRT